MQQATLGQGIIKSEVSEKGLGMKGTPNSAVGFLIDDIDYSGQGGIATTFDVEQIEVHRGPQGSRIGSNAMSRINLYKNKRANQSNLKGLVK